MDPTFVPRKVAQRARNNANTSRPRKGPTSTTIAPATGSAPVENGGAGLDREVGRGAGSPTDQITQNHMKRSDLHDLAQCLLHVLSPIFLELDPNQELRKAIQLDQEMHLSKLIVHHRLVALLCPNVADLAEALRLLEPLGFLTIGPCGFKITLHSMCNLGPQEEELRAAAVLVEGLTRRQRDPLSAALHLRTLLPANSALVILSVLPMEDPMGRLSQMINSAASIFPDRHGSLQAMDVLGHTQKGLRRQGMSSHQLLELERKRAIGREAIVLLGERAHATDKASATRQFQQMFPWLPPTEKSILEPSPGGIRSLDFLSLRRLAVEYKTRQADAVRTAGLVTAESSVRLHPRQQSERSTAATEGHSAPTYPQGTILRATISSQALEGLCLDSDALRMAIQRTLDRTVGTASVDYVALSGGPANSPTMVHLRCATTASAIALMDVLRRSAATGLVMHGIGLDAAHRVLPLQGPQILAGQEEEMYWASLPRKVVKAALKRATARM